MNRMLSAGMAIALVAAGSMASAQGRDADQILVGARTALGGDKLAAVKSVTAVGRTVRANPDGTSTENEFELALELPDKYILVTTDFADGPGDFTNSGTAILAALDQQGREILATFATGGAIWASHDDAFYFSATNHAGYAWHHGFWGLIDYWRRPKPEWWLARHIFSRQYTHHTRVSTRLRNIDTP